MCCNMFANQIIQRDRWEQVHNDDYMQVYIFLLEFLRPLQQQAWLYSSIACI